MNVSRVSSGSGAQVGFVGNGPGVVAAQHLAPFLALARDAGLDVAALDAAPDRAALDRLLDRAVRARVRLAVAVFRRPAHLQQPAAHATVAALPARVARRLLDHHGRRERRIDAGLRRVRLEGALHDAELVVSVALLLELRPPFFEERVERQPV